MTTEKAEPVVAHINARLEDLETANALYGKDARLDAPTKVERNNREISWLKGLRSIIALSETKPAQGDAQGVRDIWRIEPSVPADGFECYFLMREGKQVAEICGHQTDERTRHLDDLVFAANGNTPPQSAPPRCDAQSVEAKQLINEILDYFQNEDRDPGGDWAFPDDFSSLGLDYRDRHKTKFWIDIDRDGTIRLVWRLRGGKVKSMTFRALSKTKPAQGDARSERPVAQVRVALPDWEDERVQIVYKTLCDPDLHPPPNREEHWEGYLSRHIVQRLAALTAERPSETAAAQEHER